MQDMPLARYRVRKALDIPLFLFTQEIQIAQLVLTVMCSLSKGENRLNFVTCNSCGSRRSVQAIKTGFSAQIGKRRRMAG